MYFSRSRLNPSASKSREFWRKIGNSYDTHSLVWSMFADKPERVRDFIYRQEEYGGLPTFYCVSERKPEDDSGLWHIESKEYDPVLHSGQRLSFVLRANPILTKRDENNKQRRHDVVMEAKTRYKKEGFPREEWPTDAEIVHDEGFAWLARKGEQYGFVIKEGEVRAEGYMQQQFHKPKGRHHVRISTIEFTGLLTVTDPELFRKGLLQGVGPAKGFGCGLMMVKRPRF